MKAKIGFLVLLVLVLCVGLCACGEPEPSPESLVTELAGVMTAEEIKGLDVYENLVSLDLRGSECYDAILAYTAAHPAVDVRYDVAVAGQRLDSRTESAEIDASACGELASAAKYLPKLQSITVSGDVSRDALGALSAACPDAEIRYCVDILGTAFPFDVTELDLSDADGADVDALIDRLALLPELNTVQLQKEDGSCLLGFEDFARLADAFPDVFFQYSFTLFNQTVSTDMTELYYTLEPIGNRGVDEFYTYLPYLPRLSYLRLDRCGIKDNEKLDALNKAFPDTEVVWRVYMGEYDSFTDAEMIWLNAGVNDELVLPLKYCTKCRYLDMGHCDIHNIDFCNYMPDLEVAIFALGPLENIDPLANCPKLEYLEIYATCVSDLSPLVNCKELQHINFGSLYTIKDISPLYDLTKLKRCRSVSSGVPVEQQIEIQQLLPECDCAFGQEESSAGNWRRDEGGNYVERYALLRQQFKYDNHEGVSRHYLYDIDVD